MGSFANSFSDSFKTGAAIGSNAALETMKEKIKLDQQKAEDKLKATTFMHSTISIASKLPDQEMAKKIIGIAEEAGTGNPDVQKNINELVMKQLAPKDPYLQAQRESSTALNQATTAMLNYSQQQAGINKPTQPVEQSIISQVGSEPSTQKQEPIVTKLGVRGTEIVLPEGTQKVEEMKAFAGAEGKYKQEKIQTGEKVFAGIRNWGKTMQQFESAFPTGNKTPLKQRVDAVISGTAVKLGLMDQPQLLAAQKSLEVGARQALKEWGDKGALSNRDVDAAVRVLDLSSLTLAEKMAVVRGTAEKSMASLDDDTLNATFERQPYMKEFIDSLGIKYGQATRDQILQTSNKLKSKLPSAKDAPKGAKGWDTDKGEWVY